MGIPGEGTEGGRLRGRTVQDLRKLCGRRCEFEKRQGGVTEVGAGGRGSGCSTTCPAEEPTLHLGAAGDCGKVSTEMRRSRFCSGNPSLAAAGRREWAARVGASSLEASVGVRERGWRPGQEQGLGELWRSRRGKPPVGPEGGLCLGHPGRGAILNWGTG